MAETGEKKLAGKTVVLTGSRVGMSRDEAKDLVEAAGGKVSGYVSKKTDCTLAGSDVGSKLAMTQERELMMIEEQALRVMLQGTSD